MKKIFLGLILLFCLISCAQQPIIYNHSTIEEYEKKMRDLGYKFTARANSYQLVGNDLFKPSGGASGKSQKEANDMAMQACQRSYLDCLIVMEGSQLTLAAENAIINKKYREEYLVKAREEEKNKAKRLEEEQRESKRKYLEDNFGSKCSKNKANNVEYNKCLNDQDQIAKKEKAIQEAKQAEENKKKQLITEKQKAEEDKLNKMLAAMKPEERRAYVCEKTYGLRKGSDKFSECVYKILAADVELEKIELQKKLAEAQLETARANEAAARANAAASASRSNVPSYDPNVAAAMDRANEIERAKILLNLSQALRTPSASPQFNAPPRQQNCKLNPYNNRITCY
jgi:hypothetical protein